MVFHKKIKKGLDLIVNEDLYIKKRTIIKSKNKQNILYVPDNIENKKLTDYLFDQKKCSFISSDENILSFGYSKKLYTIFLRDDGLIHDEVLKDAIEICNTNNIIVNLSSTYQNTLQDFAQEKGYGFILYENNSKLKRIIGRTISEYREDKKMFDDYSKNK